MSSRHWVYGLAVALFTSPLGGVMGQSPSEDPELQTEMATVPSTDSFESSVIVVTGSRRAEPLESSTVSTQVIGQQEIVDSGAMNMAQLLAAQPGLQLVSSFAGTGVQIRGLDSEYVLVLINNERVNGRVDGVLDLARLSVQGVQQVEIVKGASSALYGSNAMGGVINIITSEPESGRAGSFLASYGSLSALDGMAQFSYKKGPRHVQIDGGYHSAEAWDLKPEDEATTGSAFRLGEGKLSTKLDLLDLGTLGLRGEYSLRRTTGVDSSASGAVFDRSNLTEFVTLGTSASLLPTERDHFRVEVSASLFRDQYLSDQQGSDALDVYEVSVDQLLQADFQWDRSTSKDWVYTAGAEFVGERLESPRLSEQRAQRLRAAAFAQAELSWRSGDLSLVPGARLDGDSQFGMFVTPKVAARWKVKPSWSIRSSLGRGYRAPDFKQLYLSFENPGVGYRVDGNAALEPETSLQGDLGAIYSPHKRVSAEVSVFATNMNNMIAVDIVADEPGEVIEYTYLNIAQAQIRGAELGTTISGDWGGSANLSYMFLDTLDLSTGQAFEGRSRHQVSSTLRWTWEKRGFTGQARGTLYGPRSYWIYDLEAADVLFTEMSPYALLDGRLSKTLGESLNLFVSGLNLLNEGEEDFLPIQPRTLKLGLDGVF